VTLTAIYHLHLQIITRGIGKSAVGAAAYRSGETLKNEYDGVLHDFTKKRGIVHTEILLPDQRDAGPKWASFAVRGAPRLKKRSGIKRRSYRGKSNWLCLSS
jgi:hypothetical protein